ncbi:hypothetical protein ACVDG5_018460 [Mesorhizobium sp. ORM6]
MRDKPKPSRDPQQPLRWLPEKGPHGRRIHPDFCGSGGAVKRSPFLDELDRDDA